MNAKPITIILDNAGGVTLQSGNWASYWHDGIDAAETIAALLNGEDPDLWETDEDAKSLNPTTEQIQSGGYRIVTLINWEDINLLGRESGWINERALARALLASKPAP